jgi:hypothetical protein
VRIATAKEIRRTGSVIEGFKRFKVRVSSAKAGAETIDVVKVSVKVLREVSTEVKREVSAEVKIATTKKIRRTRTGLIVRVFKRFKVRVRSSDKS